MRIISVFWVLLVLLSVAAVPSFGVLVDEVRVEGKGEREIDVESVMAYISTRPGDEFSHQGITQDIRNLRKSNRFSFVDVVRESTLDGLIITYIVHEKPRIRRLRISGADEISNKKLRELLELGVGDFVDDATLGVKTRKIVDEYNKKLYPFAKVTWTIDVDDNTGLADVEILIKEGTQAGVGEIVFEGNTVFTARELRNKMQQKERRWYSWITGSGVFNPDLLATSLNTIKFMYLDKGYLDVRVSEPQVMENNKEKIVVLIEIFEGQQYAYGTVSLTGVTKFPDNSIFELIRFEPGKAASASEIQEAAQRIQQYYGRRGYIATRVKVERDANPVSGIVDLTFVVSEGQLSYIRDVNIIGNTRTQDKVIRRELAVYPGEVLNESKVKTSEQRLRNLGFFSFVNSTYESTTRPGYYDVTFDVEEKKTGQFMVGAGFSSVDKLIGFVELGQGNFNLFGWPRFTGAGQKIKLRASFGTERRDYEISFVEPWFLDRKLSLGVDLFQNESRYYSDEYDQKNTGGSVSLTKPVSAYDRLTLSYSLQQIEVYDVADDASDYIRREEGSNLQSTLGLVLLHDTRDNYFVPNRGNRTKLAGSLSGGPLGADIDMYRLSTKTSQFWPIWFDHIISFRGEVAVVAPYGDDDEVRIFDRLYLGGPRTMRGFAYREVGVKDLKYNDEGQVIDTESIGGQTLAFGTLEYIIPVWTKVRLVGFYDMGMVYEDAYSLKGQDYTGDYNSDWGVGVRFDIPGFPLRLSYGWPIKAGEYNDGNGQWNFLIGYVL
jgi:outer membrane protein insertion porin family